MNKNYAGIDIGTNTVLMTIGNHDAGKLQVVKEEYAVARLGQDVDKNGFINEEALERTKNILSDYNKICSEYQVIEKYVVATSAVRDANNKIEVCEELASAIDSKINILSGDDEAKMSFSGTVEDERPSLVIDIGGGSTELIYGIGQNIIQKISLNVGAVRLTERFIESHPPTQNEIKSIKEFLKSELCKFKIDDLSGVNYYGVAGTATTVALTAQGLKDFEVDKIHNYQLTKDKLDEVVNLYLEATISEIITKYGVNPKRADLIASGALILQSIFEYLHIENCIISSKGLRYGALEFLIQSKIF